MFGSSNPFGQSSNNSPFGTQTQPLFGQTSNPSNNPFAVKPFGNSAPFGAQTGSSMFGGTSTGVFGAPQTSSSPFGASSQAFGSSTPAFGASSAPAFGSSTSPFGGTSTFGQKSFGLSTPQSSPFGSTTQQSQPAFGNSSFGSSSPFGASNTPAFGASSTPAFGASNTSAFGASNTSAFGATNTPGFGASSTPAFGSTNTPAFGASSTPSFGASSSPAFGASPASAFGSSGTAFGNNAFGTGGVFGASSTPAFGASSTPAFGASNTPSFGASSTPSFSFGSSPAFGQTTSAFGSSAFGSTQSPFGAQGSQASTQTVGGQSTIGGQQGGSRVMPYAPTTEAESGTGSNPGRLQSISAMPVYKEKNQEELRWEDYQRGDKGGQRPAGQSPGGAGFGVTTSQPSVFSPSPTFGQTPANPTNPFAQKTPTTTPNFSSPFGQPTTPSFGQPTTPSFGQPTTPSMFGSIASNATSVFGSSTSFATSTQQPFGSAPAHGSNSPFSIVGNNNTSQSSPLFGSNPSFGQSTTPAFQQTSSAFGLNTTPTFQQTSSAFGQNTTPANGQSNIFSTPSTGSANLFSSSPSFPTSISPYGQTTPALSTPYQSVQPTQPSGAFVFNNFAQTQPSGNTTGVTGGTGTFSQSNFKQVPAFGNSAIMQPTPVTNPFGTLPALPQVSIGQGGNSPSIQYGISSMPVVDKPAPVRVSPLLTSRHLLQRRVRLPTRKYRPGDDGPKVPFFSDEENSSTPKADALFIPRENPRALFIRPVERVKSEHPKDGPAPLQENGNKSNGVTNGTNHENKHNGETCEAPPVKANQKPNRTHENHGGEKNGSHSSPSGAEIETLMPKLHHAEYFTEPRIQELATKERVDPGHCKRVKDFVVGRHGYGSIKFLGETDVCRLDLEMVVQFKNREVNVYMDESKKPPVGQGLNKPAVVTLLNIKCMDKKTGTQVKEGARLDKYKEMLKRKAEEQGAKFVSYDAVKGEWTFKVEHFSSYKLGEEDDM
ncbi:PREDICTED: nuclear pore complex protein NUP98B-like [Camelina sativa]|uniref:Nuclear pore complex protein NUP98B-like n=1 Tax=Camelina sativa TaxID=90675 RepID=A0ABM0Z6A0_CAMSA|nr:PREDICTED: nuclear pore complex protein NUP98B-like [Camelina sativa]